MGVTELKVNTSRFKSRANSESDMLHTHWSDSQWLPREEHLKCSRCAQVWAYSCNCNDGNSTTGSKQHSHFVL